MFLCPRYCCKARVSWPSLASLNPQAWRSMCGWIGNGILAVSPTRWMRRWKPMGLIGPTAFGNEHVGVLRVIASYFTQSPHLVTADRMVFDGWNAFPGCRFHADKPSLRGN